MDTMTPKRVTRYKQNFEKCKLGMMPPKFLIIDRGMGCKYQKVVDTYRGYGSFKALQLCSAINAPVNIHYYFEPPKRGTIGFEIYVKPSQNYVGYVHFIDADNYSSTKDWGLVKLYYNRFEGLVNKAKYLKAPSQWHKITVEMSVETGLFRIWYAERKPDEFLSESKFEYINNGDAIKNDPDVFTRVNGVEFGVASLCEPGKEPIYFDDFELYQLTPWADRVEDR